MTIAADQVDTNLLRQKVAEFKTQGYRFVTITCVQANNCGAELLYHFDRKLELHHLRLKTEEDIPLPSICAIYKAAYLVENEIQDQFGLRFEGLEPDYQRTLYLQGKDAPAPFRSPDEPQGEE